MYLNAQDLIELERIKRLNIINSISGIKPATVIGTHSATRGTNLAIISSVVHLSSSPALIGFFCRPSQDFRRDTLRNIKTNKQFTINQVTTDFIEHAHYTSAKFPEDVSEFDSCRLTEEYIEDFQAPFVQESLIKIGLTLQEIIEIPSSGTSLIVGRIAHVLIPDDIVDENGYIDLESSKTVGVSGLNSYYSLKYSTSLPYARVEELPPLQKLSSKKKR